MNQQHPPRDLEFAPQILRLEHAPPAPLPRRVLYLLLALFLIVVLWACFGRLDVITVAEGRLIPQNYLQIVQPAEPGTLREILVKEGERVQAGQILMRMDTQVSDADSKILQAEMAQRLLQLRRIDAELTGSPLVANKDDSPELLRQVQAQYSAHRQAYLDAIAQEQAVLAKARQDLAAAEQVLAKLEETLPVYQAQEEAWSTLGKEGFAGRLTVMDKSRERIEREQDYRAQQHHVESLKAGIAQSEKRLASIGSNYRQQLQNERVEAAAALEKLKQEWAKQAHRHTLLALKAPQSGVMKDIATHTIGTVVAPGTILMTLVPSAEPLQAEVMIKNEDVGFVRPEQAVKVKLAAYPFQKYGMLDGVVAHVSADASDIPGRKEEAGQSASAYKALVKLNAQHLAASAEQYPLSAGMQVVAEIKQGDRTILEYLLSPVRKTVHEAARER